MSELQKRSGMKFIGEVPKVFVQAPFIKTSAHSVKCTGCSLIVHALDLKTAICPYCVGKELEDK